ncbi:MAG: hemerythrin domain-containing protein [Anaerolineae bacterium]|jgi:hemerythrin-like domain-containing protein
MMPIGPLMIEHRLIERMITLLDDEAQRIRRTRKVDTVVVETAVDFIRTYADRTHHGKEEDILFRDLKGKKLSAGDQAMMDKLIEQHVYARRLVGDLVAAKEDYLTGDAEALETVLDKLDALVRLYPGHIETEDNPSFWPLWTI